MGACLQKVVPTAFSSTTTTSASKQRPFAPTAVTIDHPLSVDENTALSATPATNWTPTTTACLSMWCQHGTPTSHLKVTEDGEHCASCDTGSMDKGSNVCRPFEVTCDFGSPNRIRMSHKTEELPVVRKQLQTGRQPLRTFRCVVPTQAKSHMKVTPMETCEVVHRLYDGP